MNHNIESIKATRKFLLELIKDLSTEELNAVPQGFNNNIIWNLGHMVAAQQGICYLRAGLSPIVEEKFILEFKPGTKPERKYDDSEIEGIKQMMFDTLDRFLVEFEKNTFGSYNTFTTRYEVVLSNIHEAVSFLQFHEGLHTGYIMALKKVVKTA
jgi:hypothetical protein